MNYILLQTIGLGEQWVNTTTMGFPDMVIVGTGLHSNSVKRFPNKLSYDEIFKMNSSVWRDVRSRDGSRSGIVRLHEGNKVWRVSPDNEFLISQGEHLSYSNHLISITFMVVDPFEDILLLVG